MPGNMKALRYHGRKDIRVDEVPIPVCGAGQVKVKPAFSGICGTDLHEYLGGPNIIPTKPHALTQEQLPVTLGHEFSGIVEEVGDDIKDVQPGDHVVIRPIIYDNTCGPCKDGFINCCDVNGWLGISGWGGGMSEHIVVPRYTVMHVPKSIPLDLAALVEPIAVAWHAVKISKFSPADTPSVLILGTGPIGLSLILTLRAQQCPIIIVSEPSTARASLAKRFGAHHVLNPLVEDVPARVREICGNSDNGGGGDGAGSGSGVHIAYDAAGVQVGLDAAVRATRVRGLVVGIAVWEGRASVSPGEFMFKERGYVGVATYLSGDFEEVIEAIEDGRIQPREMITRIVRLDEVEEKGFKSLIEDKDHQIKILVEI